MKEDSVKAGLNFSIQKTKIMASGLITSWQTDGRKMESVAILFSKLEAFNIILKI